MLLFYVGWGHLRTLGGVGVRTSNFCVQTKRSIFVVSIYLGRLGRFFCDLFFQGILFGAFLLFMRASFTSSNACVTVINVNRFAQTVSSATRSASFRSLRIDHDELSTNSNQFRIMRYASTAQAESMFNFKDASASYLRSAGNNFIRFRIASLVTIIVRRSAITRPISGRNARINDQLSLRILYFNFLVRLRRCR